MQINKETECEIVKKKLMKTQEDWVTYFNNKGEKMVSAPDIYKVAKQEKKTLIGSLKKDFEEDAIITSTKIVYNKNNLKAEVIHDADSKIAKPKKYKIKVPELVGEPKQDKETEAYLQALFDTKDNITTILRILRRFDQGKKIHLWTPSQSSRANKQVRAVVLYFGNIRFGVVGDNWFGDSYGLSRGVIIDSAKQSKKTKGVGAR